MTDVLCNVHIFPILVYIYIYIYIYTHQKAWCFFAPYIFTASWKATLRWTFLACLSQESMWGLILSGSIHIAAGLQTLNKSTSDPLEIFSRAKKLTCEVLTTTCRWLGGELGLGLDFFLGLLRRPKLASPQNLEFASPCLCRAMLRQNCHRTWPCCWRRGGEGDRRIELKRGLLSVENRYMEHFPPFSLWGMTLQRCYVRIVFWMSCRMLRGLVVIKADKWAAFTGTLILKIHGNSGR